MPLLQHRPAQGSFHRPHGRGRAARCGGDGGPGRAGYGVARCAGRPGKGALVYDEEKSAFTLLPGSSQELCYLGGDAVLTPQPLTGGETLRMGGAAMKFVPFCGAEFHW